MAGEIKTTQPIVAPAQPEKVYDNVLARNLWFTYDARTDKWRMDLRRALYADDGTIAPAVNDRQYREGDLKAVIANSTTFQTAWAALLAAIEEYISEKEAPADDSSSSSSGDPSSSSSAAE